MGFGDPYHKHSLREVPHRYVPTSTNCFHCDLPIDRDFSCYGCKDCNYYIHKLCQDLPIKLRVPLHDQHLLTLFEPPPNSSSSSASSNSPNICIECQNPCLGRFSYHCTTCQLFFHLKCLFTLKLEKHKHPLIFDSILGEECKICGSYIYGFDFGCNSCRFYIHQECSLIPLEIKHRHIHKLALRHNFPEECDQVYCDLCEDRDGEMEREQSYYYCKDCDYIAHVNCCIAQPREDVFLLCERFTHEHPLRPNKTEHLLSCSQCSYTVGKYTREYPSLVKHPHHPHHTFLLDSKQTDNFNCTECNFSMHKDEFVKFKHPLWRYSLEFICKNSLYRCDACGELGKGSRINYVIDGKFDLHLECFALPGTLELESHPKHPLYLRWLDESTSQCCSICRKEMDPQLWFYICQECNYAAHMDCVARDLLSTLRSSIMNQPDLCAIIEPNESSFKYHIADMQPPAVSSPPYSREHPVLEVDGDDDYDDNDEADNEGNSDLGIETIAYELACPKCDSHIATQAGYSTIKKWKSSFLENRNVTANDRTPSGSEPSNFLDEQIVDELCCSICNMLIFPPTYSCASCHTYFHKSCAELPRKILFNETTYVLTEPPFPEGLSNCTRCNYPISNFAYLSTVGGFIFDIQCAVGAPLVNPVHHDHMLSFQRAIKNVMCKACEKYPELDKFVMKCSYSLQNCVFVLHLECGLLPAIIKHRIHQHPLELATDLAKLDCEYFCDVCEKDLNPDLWAYRCMDICGIWATSHVSCVISSKKKCHFSYDDECQKWTEEKKLEFRRKAKERGKRTVDSTSEHVALNDHSTCSSLE